MKKISIILFYCFFLFSCSKDPHERDYGTPSFTIPEAINEVNNSWAITVNGEEVTLSGKKLKVWDKITDVVLDKKAPFFDTVETITLSDFTWIKVIETVPSLDTPVCTLQTKQLEFAAETFSEINFIAISNDTPFALERFCAANGIDNLTTLSDARSREFGNKNSLYLPDYALLTRAIMILDEDNVIQYIEYANEVTSELDLMNALAFLKNMQE